MFLLFHFHLLCELQMKSLKVSKFEHNQYFKLPFYVGTWGYLLIKYLSVLIIFLKFRGRTRIFYDKQVMHYPSCIVVRLSQRSHGLCVSTFWLRFGQMGDNDLEGIRWWVPVSLQSLSDVQFYGRWGFVLSAVLRGFLQLVWRLCGRTRQMAVGRLLLLLSPTCRPLHSCPALCVTMWILWIAFLGFTRSRDIAWGLSL
jgi:hypothetical protein